MAIEKKPAFKPLPPLGIFNYVPEEKILFEKGIPIKFRSMLYIKQPPDRVWK